MTNNHGTAIHVRGRYWMQRVGDGSYCCETCGSFVLDPEKHADYHDQKDGVTDGRR